MEKSRSLISTTLFATLMLLRVLCLCGNGEAHASTTSGLPHECCSGIDENQAGQQRNQEHRGQESQTCSHCGDQAIGPVSGTKFDPAQATSNPEPLLASKPRAIVRNQLSFLAGSFMRELSRVPKPPDRSILDRTCILII